MDHLCSKYMLYIWLVYGQSMDDLWIIYDYWLVVEVSTPLKNMRSSIGMMNFPIYGKIKNVPNHQSAKITNLKILQSSKMIKNCTWAR